MSYGQQQDTAEVQLDKNSVYFNLNFGLGGPEFTFGPGLTYERQLVRFKQSYLYAQFGWGYWLRWGVSANAFKLDLAYIIGKKSSHIEFDLGAYYLNECDNYDDICFDNGKIKLLANIAYRYQNPAKSMILRIGVGTQALVFVSIGKSF